MEPGDKYDKYELTYDERREIIDCVKQYFSLSKEERQRRQYSDFEPETERRGWLSKRKTFENLKLKVDSWPDELPDIDLSEIERIYLRPDYYQLLPFQSNRTYTRKVMSQFLYDETEYEPVNDPDATTKSGASSSRTSTRNSNRTSNRTLNSGKNQAKDQSLIASSSRRTGEATSSSRQNFHFELQSDREDPDNEGIFSRLRRRLVNSAHTSNDNQNNNQSHNPSIQTSIQTSTKTSTKTSNNTNGSSDRPLEIQRMNLMEAVQTNLNQSSDSRFESNQKVSQKGRTLASLEASRESSLIKQRLLKKQIWLDEQAMLTQSEASDMNANYLDEDLNGLSSPLAGYSDDESDLNQKKDRRSDGPLTSVNKRRTSNRTKTPSKLYTAGGIASLMTRKPAKRKAKENHRCKDKEVRFAVDSHLNFSDLDEPDFEHDENSKESFYELEPLKAPTKQLYLFVALVFLSVFAFKFINSS